MNEFCSHGEALLRFSPDRWLRFRNPCAVVQAFSFGEVVSALQRVEMYCLRGLHAVGGVSYEAAPAFDTHLQVRSSGGPLLWFALYASAQELTDLQVRSPDHFSPVAFYPLKTADSYHRAFCEVQQRISAGDTYQVNYSFPLRAADSFDLRRFFLKHFAPLPSGYLFFQNMGETQIASSSPELFFERREKHLRTRPMKGTRPRATEALSDLALRDDLASHPKDRAENLMIVDMMRNDLGRIAETGSVHVDSLLEIENYPTVWQMVSEISAASSASLAEIFSALFPCASVTGAPKDAAMKIIAHLETQGRGFYTGALGHINPGGNACFSVAIRTLTSRAGEPAVYRVGSGLVADSSAEDEYAECLHKTRVLGKVHAEMQLLETALQLPGGNLWLAGEHLRRLRNSCAALGFRHDVEQIRKAIHALESSDQFARIRFLCAVDGRITVQRTLLASDPRAMAESWKVQTVICPAEWATPFSIRHKTTLRAHYDSILQGNPGCDDILLCRPDGFLTESCKANIVLEDHLGIWTPPVEHGLLPGVMRSHLLRTGKIRERPLHRNELNTARNIWLINSLRGWIRITIDEP